MRLSGGSCRPRAKVNLNSATRRSAEVWALSVCPAPRDSGQRSVPSRPEPHVVQAADGQLPEVRPRSLLQ